jgi:hypothetical protein
MKRPHALTQTDGQVARYGGVPDDGSIHASERIGSPPIAVAGCIHDT